MQPPPPTQEPLIRLYQSFDELLEGKWGLFRNIPPVKSALIQRDSHVVPEGFGS